MREIDPNSLPIQSKEIVMEIDPARITRFNALLGRKKSDAPLTLGAISLPGVFEILNQLEVDWSKLLHISQKFEFENHDPQPKQMKAVSRLKRHRFRAGSHWLQFETEIELGESKILTHAQIVVGA